MSMQKVTIVGNVGKDAEFSYTPQGIALLKFSVAVNKKTGKDKDGNAKEMTTWYRVAIWRQRAEGLSGLIKKGQKVIVIGDLKATAYIAQDGTAMPSLDIDCSDFDWAGGKDEQPKADSHSDEPVQQGLPGTEGEETGDIPF